MKKITQIILLAFLTLAFIGGIRQWRVAHWYKKAGELYEKNLFEDALFSAQKASRLDPKNPEKKRLLAKIYLELVAGRNIQTQLNILRKAEKELIDATSIEPLYPYYWAELGRVEELIERLGEQPARSPSSCFHRAVVIDPNNPLFVEMFFRYLVQKGSCSSAQNLLKRQLELEPKSALELAKLWLVNNCGYDALIQLLSSNPKFLSGLALWMVTRKEFKELAEKTAYKAHLQSPEDKKLAFNYGWILAEMSKCAQAKKVLEKFFNEPEWKKPALEEYGLCLFRTHKWQEAEKIYLELISITPEQVNYRWELARIYLALKDYEKAKQQLIWLSERADSSLRKKAWLALGKIYEKENNRIKAIQAYESYLKLNPKDQKIKNKLKKLKPAFEEIIYSPWRIKNEK